MQMTITSPKSLNLAEEQHTSAVKLPIRDVPVTDSRFKPVWQRVRAKLKSRVCLQLLKHEINLFGANTLPQGELDLTPADEFLRKKIYLSQNIEEVQVQKKDFYVLLPGGYLKSCWSLVYLALMLYTITLAPYSMAFWDDAGGWQTTEIVIDSLFFFDIMITFNSAYINRQGQLVTNRRTIAAKYAKSWLVLDFCACFPIYLFQDDNMQFSSDGNTQYNALLRLARLPRFYRLFRIARIYRMMKQFRNYRVLERIHEKVCGNRKVVHVLSFFVMVVICAHLMACFWYIIARAEGLSTNCWVFHADLQGADPITLYFSSFLWALATLATVGYGDIFPTTTLERIAASLWMTFGMCALSFVISSIVLFLHQADLREMTLMNKLEIISEFATENKLDSGILIRLKEAIRFNVMKSGYSLLEKRDLFQELPRQLKYEVAISMHNHAIKSIPFFANRDQVFISSIVPFLRSEFVPAHAFVYREKEYAEEIYFIANGRCEMKFNEVHVIKKLQQGSYFGEIEVIEMIPRMFSIFTAADCTLLTMKKRLLTIIKADFPKVYEEMKEVATIRKELNAKSKRQFLKLLRLAHAENITQEEDMERFLRLELRRKMRLNSVKPLRVVNLNKDSKLRLVESVEEIRRRVDKLEPAVYSMQKMLIEILETVGTIQKQS